MCSADWNRAGMSTAAGTAVKAGSSSWRTYWPVLSAAQRHTYLEQVCMTASITQQYERQQVSLNNSQDVYSRHITQQRASFKELTATARVGAQTHLSLDERRRPDHASSHICKACAYASQAQRFPSAFNQLTELIQVQVTAVITMSAFGLYTYLE